MVDAARRVGGCTAGADVAGVEAVAGRRQQQGGSQYGTDGGKQGSRDEDLLLCRVEVFGLEGAPAGLGALLA